MDDKSTDNQPDLEVQPTPTLQSSRLSIDLANQSTMQQDNSKELSVVKQISPKKPSGGKKKMVWWIAIVIIVLLLVGAATYYQLVVKPSSGTISSINTAANLKLPPPVPTAADKQSFAWKVNSSLENLSLKGAITTTIEGQLGPYPAVTPYPYQLSGTSFAVTPEKAYGFKIENITKADLATNNFTTIQNYLTSHGFKVDDGVTYGSKGDRVEINFTQGSTFISDDVICNIQVQYNPDITGMGGLPVSYFDIISCADISSYRQATTELQPFYDAYVTSKGHAIKNVSLAKVYRWLGLGPAPPESFIKTSSDGSQTATINIYNYRTGSDYENGQLVDSSQVYNFSKPPGGDWAYDQK